MRWTDIREQLSFDKQYPDKWLISEALKALTEQATHNYH